jgi:OmcA/MtrC family decaheme c-type cytochrome
MQVTKSRAIAFALALALSACAGSDGKNGAQGPAGPAGQDGAAGANGAAGAQGPAGANGKDFTATAQPESCEVCHRDAGTEHQAVFNAFADGLSSDPATGTKLAATIEGVASAAEVDGSGNPTGKFTATVTFTLSRGGVAYNDDTPVRNAAGTVTSPALGATQQKTIYATSYDVATKTFTTAKSFSFGTWTRIGDGRYTAVKKGLGFRPENEPSLMVYGYFGDKLVLPVKGHYNLMDNVVSVSRTYGAPIDYVSTANVAGCEKCHPAPYSKHGYRQAHVAGLPDFAACKACHSDQRAGVDFNLAMAYDDPAELARIMALGPGADGEPQWTDAVKAKYAYTATIMADTHISHAMEFDYPQSMANCATCHAGKLGAILTDANFKLATCRSCHPVNPDANDAKRAPSLQTMMSRTTAGQAVHAVALQNLSTYAGPCNGCHQAAPNGVAPTFADFHSGYDKAIADSSGAKYSATIKAKIDSASFDAATKKLTVQFSASGMKAGAIVKPTVVVSLYGYDSKDFIVTGHGSQPAPDGKRNLEWTEAASGNSPRLSVAPGVGAADVAAWTATADLTLWADKLADGTVKRLEIGILPTLGLDQTKAVSATNPAIAMAGETRTFSFAANGLVADADSYGKAIVSTAKCQSCHDALGTTFHSPSYGSAGVTACRLCHVGLSGGSHLEMQSRSIDSYVHAIHSSQAFDVKGINFADPAQKYLYGLKMESSYPSFTTLNCESCHNPGTYGVPDQSRSMPGVLSASASLTGWDRNIGAIPSVVTGPASRACGSCHRAALINEDKAGDLASFDAHTATFGTRLPADVGVLDAAIAKIMALFK